MLSIADIEMNFKDSLQNVCEIPSTWKTDAENRDYSQKTTQTNCIETREVAVQSYSQNSIHSQTITEKPRHGAPKYDNQKLVEFLSKAERAVSKQLLQNIKSKAFDGYVVEWDEEKSSSICIHTLAHQYQEEEMECTDISWSITGSSIAVAYGRFDHKNWCVHKGMLCVWNLNLRDFNPSKAKFTADTLVTQRLIIDVRNKHFISSSFAGNFSRRHI